MTPLSPVLLLAALNTLAAQRHAPTPALRLARALGPTWLRRLEPRSDDRIASPLKMRAQLDLIHLLGFWAHYDLKYRLSSWPIPHMASAELLEEFAEQEGVLVNAPDVGDIYIAAARNGRLSQVGIVTTVQLAVPFPGLPAAVTCHTARGVPLQSGVPKQDSLSIVLGKRCLTTTRGDRFIRWADLDWRHILARRVAA